MASEPMPCVNHKDTTTRLSCSQCDAPICSRCVRSSAVGQRCPSCAKPSRARAARGKPEHYVRALAAGGALSVMGGLLMTMVGFGAIILSALLGFAVGRAVAWGTRGQTQSPFPAVAAGTAVAGIAVAFVLVYGTPVPPAGLRVIAYPIAGWFATRGLHR